MRHWRLVGCLFLIAIMMSACHKHFDKIKCRFHDSNRVILNVPTGYSFEGASGNHEREYRYWYSDSSVIYITTFENTLNYDNINAHHLYYDRFQAFHKNDSLTLSGTNENNCYWIDKLLPSGISIGYSNVPTNKVELFNNIIDNARIK